MDPRHQRHVQRIVVPLLDSCAVHDRAHRLHQRDSRHHHQILQTVHPWEHLPRPLPPSRPPPHIDCTFVSFPDPTMLHTPLTPFENSRLPLGNLGSYRGGTLRLIFDRLF